MTDHAHSNAAHAPNGGHEPNEISARGLTIVGIGLTAMVIASLLLVALIYHWMANRVLAPSAEAPVPALNRWPVDQPRQLQDLHEKEDKQLNNYKWLDQPQGIARIPINRAMELLVEQQSAARNSQDQTEGTHAE